MHADDLLHIGHGSVRNFHCVSIDDLVQRVSFRKTGVNYLEKLCTYPSFHIG